MRTVWMTTIVTGVVVTAAACAPRAGTLEAASETLGTAQIDSIQISGSGRWYQFGQAPNPTLGWPRFDVSRFEAEVSYTKPSARIQMTRLQALEPGRERPAPAEQRLDQHVSGGTAWNMVTPAGAPSDAPATAQWQPAAVEERVMEIWTTPHGFLWAAAVNHATEQVNSGGGSDVSFTIGKNRYAGTIDAESHVERVRTWIDNPVLGDTPVEFSYFDYRDFGGVMFPSRILRTQGGHPVLDITVSAVKTNGAPDVPVPAVDGAALPPQVMVTAEKLAEGVYYLKGGTHHSVAIDQKDHIVVVEAPQNEARSLAVIAKVKETIPNKPIRYLVNTHVHFDHSGGLRTYVDEGATIVTHAMNRPYYERAWADPRTINPDRLAQSKKTAVFATFTETHVLDDGGRTIEIHQIAGGGHNDAFAMVYLPREKILIEGDAYTPAAADAPPPAAPNPYSVNLYDNIQRLKLDVGRIAALHGPRLTTMADLRGAIGQTAP